MPITVTPPATQNAPSRTTDTRRPATISVATAMPGTSRSGVTMTAGRALGLSRSGAARFSFLLAVPGIGAVRPP